MTDCLNDWLAGWLSDCGGLAMALFLLQTHLHLHLHLPLTVHVLFVLARHKLCEGGQVPLYPRIPAPMNSRGQGP